MIKIITAIWLLSVSSFSLAASFSADDILGYWLSESGKGVIEIYKVDDKYQGKIVWVEDIHKGVVKDKLDVKNPDKALQARSLQGLQNLQGFSWKKDKWRNGTVYDPSKGKTYSSYMTMINKDTLELRGFVGIALFGRTSTMKRQQTAVPDSYTN